MKITGSFKDINDDLVTVVIESTAVGTNITFEETTDSDGNVMCYFSDDPLQIETECEDNFTHIIKKSAEIEFYSTKWLGDYLFAGKPSDTTVTVSKGDTVVFYGHIEPNVYTQPYSETYNSIKINCTDFLATLEYNYLASNESAYNARKIDSEVRSFYDYLDIIFGDTDGCIYYDGSKTNNGENVFTTVGVSENLFLGEDFDDMYTNEELLEEILKFLNLHIIQEGKDFYIFDWNSVKNNNISWITLRGDTASTLTSEALTVTVNDYMSDDTDISVADVYNQIAVTDKLESIEDVISSPMDDDSVTSLWPRRKRYMTEIWAFGEGKSSNSGFHNWMMNDYDDGYDAQEATDFFTKLAYNASWDFNYFDGSNFKSVYNGTLSTDSLAFYDLVQNYKYCPFLAKWGHTEHKAGTASSTTYKAPDSMENYITITVNGSGDDSETKFAEIGNYLQTIYNKAVEEDTGIIVYKSTTAAAWGQIGGDDATNYFVFSGEMMLQPLLNHSWYTDGWWSVVDNNREGSGNGRYGVYFYDSTGTNKLTSGHPTNYPYYLDRFYFSDPDEDWKNDTWKYAYNSDGSVSDNIGKIGILQCQLKVGDKYCVELCNYTLDSDGNKVWGYDSTYKWMTKEEWETAKTSGTADASVVEEAIPSFSLGYDPNIGDYIVGNKFDISNNITDSMNLGDNEGTAIAIPSDLYGQLEFRIIAPVNSEFVTVWRRHPTMFRSTKFYANSKNVLDNISAIVIKDFECKIVSDNGNIENDGDADIVYCSDETDKYIKKKDDVEFNINTLLSASEAYELGVAAPTINISTAINVSDNSAFKNLTDNNEGITAYAEKLYVDHYYKEFNTPKIIVETTLDNNTINVSPFNTYTIGYLGKTFYPLSINTDMRMASSTITLKEV